MAYGRLEDAKKRVVKDMDGEAQKSKGWSAGRRPGKPGKVAIQFPTTGSKFMGKKPKGKLPMGGGPNAKGSKGKKIKK
jgi:hypothetical protein